MNRVKIKYMGYSALWDLTIPGSDYIPTECPFPYVCNKYMVGEYYTIEDGKCQMYIYTNNSWYKNVSGNNSQFKYSTLRTTRNYSEREWEILRKSVYLLGIKSFNKQFQREFSAKTMEDSVTSIIKNVSRRMRYDSRN